MSEDELVASVLIFSIVFTAVPRTFRVATGELRKLGMLDSKSQPTESESGLLQFFSLLVDIAKRIAISLSVQLLAANVRAKQPNRVVRIVSLLSVAVFFLFLEASSSIGVKVRR